MTEWKNLINLDATKITCVQAQNSTAFIECVFENYEKNRVVAISTQSSLEQFNEENGLAAQHFLTPQNEGRWLNAKLSLPDSDEPAQIAFTSGTEGRPKAIVSSYSNLNDVVNRINAAMEVTADIREYIGVPVYHSFGLGRCRAVSAAGGKAFIPQAGFDLK